ncbi:MAG: DUF393 domain-containing protein [Pseudomonadota bacterium]
MSGASETRVLYNGDCPVCRAEMDHYRKVAARADLPVRFDDLNGPDRAAWGIDADDAARRLHVRNTDGEVVSGFAAFLALWAEMPRMRHVGRVLGLPGLRQGMSALYDHVGAPLLYRMHRRRQARRDGEGLT